MRASFAVLAIVVGLLTTVRVSAVAADWPASPVRIIVPFPPGGAPDALARIVAEHLTNELKQSVVVENRTGAGGIIGSRQAARAEPDGYTLVLAGAASHVVAPLVNPQADYHPLRDFTHIAYIGGPPMVLVVTPTTDIYSIDHLAANARKGTLSGYTTLGVGTIGHLLVEHIARTKGVKITHVPFTKVPLAEILTGRVPVGAFAWGAVLGQLEAGKVRAIALGTESRLPNFPNVPTFKDQGFNMAPTTWVSLAGPRGLSPNIVQRLNTSVRRILTRPDVRQQLDRTAVEVKLMSPEALVKFYEEEIALWGSIVEGVGLKRK